MMTPIASKSEIRIDVPAIDVWAVMEKFGDLSWAAGIDEVVTKGEGLDMVREVRLTGKTGWIVERLVLLDPNEMRIGYVIDNDGMEGFSEYSAEAQVLSEGDGSIISWVCDAKVDESERDQRKAQLDFTVNAIVQLFAMQFSKPK